jgi:hypothetical protein
LDGGPEPGGAICYADSSISLLEIVSCTFLSCSSSGNGGAIFADGNSVLSGRLSLNQSFASDCSISSGDSYGQFVGVRELGQAAIWDCSVLRCGSGEAAVGTGGIYLLNSAPLTCALVNITSCEMSSYDACLYRGGNRFTACICIYLTIDDCYGSSAICIAGRLDVASRVDHSDFFNTTTPDLNDHGILVAAGSLVYVSYCYFMGTGNPGCYFASRAPAQHPLPSVPNCGLFHVSNCSSSSDFPMGGQNWINPTNCGDECGINNTYTSATEYITYTRTDLMGYHTDPFSPSADFSVSFNFPVSEQMTLSDNLPVTNHLPESSALPFSNLFSDSRPFTFSSDFSASSKLTFSDRLEVSEDLPMTNHLPESSALPFSNLFNDSRPLTFSSDFSVSFNFAISDRFEVSENLPVINFCSSVFQ